MQQAQVTHHFPPFPVTHLEAYSGVPFRIGARFRSDLAPCLVYLQLDLLARDIVTRDVVSHLSASSLAKVLLLSLSLIFC